MKISTHAQKRCQQRGINRKLIFLILAFGKSVRKVAGAREVFIPKKHIKKLIIDLKHLSRQIEKCEGTAVLVSEDNNIITVYHLR